MCLRIPAEVLAQDVINHHQSLRRPSHFWSLQTSALATMWNHLSTGSKESKCCCAGLRSETLSRFCRGVCPEPGVTHLCFAFRKPLAGSSYVVTLINCLVASAQWLWPGLLAQPKAPSRHWRRDRASATARPCALGLRDRRFERAWNTDILWCM